MRRSSSWWARLSTLVGVAVIVVGIVVASVIFAVRLQGRPGREDYRRYRQGIGRAILLGLEFLAAGDIIRTVAVSPTFQSVGVLAAIVAIRTILSMSLEVELEGRWPWDRAGRSRSGREAERDSSGDQERGH